MIPSENDSLSFAITLNIHFSRRWCRGRTSAPRTKGFGFEPRDERVLPVGSSRKNRVKQTSSTITSLAFYSSDLLKSGKRCSFLNYDASKCTASSRNRSTPLDTQCSNPCRTQSILMIEHVQFLTFITSLQCYVRIKVYFLMKQYPKHYETSSNNVPITNCCPAFKPSGHL